MWQYKFRSSKDIYKPRIMHVIKREEKDKRKRQEGREEWMNKSHKSQK